MKKIMLIAVIAASFASCKKNENASEKITTETTTTTTNATTPVATTETTNTAESTNVATQTGQAQIAFDNKMHNFGDVKKGSQNAHEFVITNKGTADLVIIDAKASCGCTVPEKPTQPIKPGQSAKLKVAFNGNSVGKQEKTVTVTSNATSATETLTIKANVIE